MFARATDIFRIEELRKKILVTLSLLAVFRLGFHVPLPGVDAEALSRFLHGGKGGAAGLVDLFNILSAGSLLSCTLFSLGIMPYISSSIIFSLLTKVVPTLEKIAKEGSQGQRRINQWTRLATVPICVVQSLFVWASMKSGSFLLGNDTQLVPEDIRATFWFAATVVIGLTAGTIFVMWLGEQITEYGIGNGVSLLIMANIVVRIPDAVGQILSESMQPDHRTEITKLGLLAVLFLVVTMGVVYITKGQRRVPVQYAKLVRGRSVYGGQKHYLPLKVNAVSVMPVIFSSTLLIIPQQGLHYAFQNNALDRGAFLYSTLDIAGIVFFSFFWVGMMFNPKEMADQIKEHGAFIPGIRPGRRTQEYLDEALQRVTLAGAFFLAVIALVPDLIARGMGLPQVTATFVGGTSILITVSVALDLADRINSYLLMRNYKGFMDGGSLTGGGGF